MSQLAKLQQTFQDCVINSVNSQSNSWISASGRAEPDVQLSIYTHAYRARLSEVLNSDFPAMLMAVGEDQFNEIIHHYIEQYPSHYFSLREFGRDMPCFISDLLEAEKLEKNMAWLYELSFFEWSLGQTFDAADKVLFTEQDMVTIPAEAWPDLKFTLHPSVQRINLEWNTPEMWLAMTAEEPKNVTAENQGSSPWLIWREDFVTRFRSMQLDEQLAFDALAQSKDFNDVCETLTEIMDEEDIPMHVASLLKAWITQGLIISVN